MNAASFVPLAWIVALAASVTQLGGDAPRRSPDRYLGFAFEKGGCELGPLSCQQRIPREWTAGEIKEVKGALDGIAEKPVGTLVLERCQEHGVALLRRYGVPASPGPTDAGGAWMPDAALHRDPFVTSIDIFDAFFRSRGQRDQFSGSPGYLLTAQVLLHECFHAIDDLSDSPEFLSLVGFVRAGSRMRFSATTESEISALTRFGAEIQKAPLSDRGEPWRITRSYALQMRPVRVPSMQSLQSPAEAFADIGSHLILDPRARRYPPAEVVARSGSVTASADRTP